jgi:hypothetical protein
VIAAGLQDNGVCYCRWLHQSPWAQLVGSDGEVSALVPGGDLFFNNSNPPESYGRRGRWDSVSINLVDYVVPLLNQDGTKGKVYHRDGTENFEGYLGGADNHNCIIEPVSASSLTSSLRGNQGSKILAVGGLLNCVYGLFPDKIGQPFWHWERLATIDGIDVDDFITTVGSDNGSTIFVGTNKGRMFWVSSAQSRAFELPVRGDAAAEFTQILVNVPNAYALAPANRRIYELSYTWQQQDDVFVQQFEWDPVASQFPGVDPIYSIGVDWSYYWPIIYVASSRLVYVTTDDGGSGGPIRMVCPKIPTVRGYEFPPINSFSAPGGDRCGRHLYGGRRYLNDIYTGSRRG